MAPHSRSSISVLPDDVFPVTTGPASQAIRRGYGGKEFWHEDQTRMVVRTGPLRGRHKDETGEVYTVFEPEDDRPLLNWNLSEEEQAQTIGRFLQGAWDDVRQLGPDEADWFDLLTAMHIGSGNEWQVRTRDDPRTWTQVPLTALKRMRARGALRGFRSPQERATHQAAIERVLRQKLIWTARGSQEAFPIFHWTRLDAQARFDGSWVVSGYRIYPTWWFDMEMGVESGNAGMYFAAGLRMVVQIPTNRKIAKAVARYCVSGFWRQRATRAYLLETKRYRLPIKELLDCAGIPVPEWAISRPTQFADDFLTQVRSISDPRSEGALITMPSIAAPDRGKGAWERWIEQEIELRPHPEAPAPLHETIQSLELGGERGLRRRQAIADMAAARIRAIQIRNIRQTKHQSEG